MNIFDILGGFLLGFLFPVKSAINATLLAPTDSPTAPGFISNATGFLFLALFLPLQPVQKDGKKKLTVKSPEQLFSKENFQLFKHVSNYLYVAPGFVAAVLVTLAPIVGNEIGYSLFFVSAIAGQIVSALLVDAYGFEGLPVTKPTKYRIACLALVLAGAVLTVVDGLESTLEAADVSAVELIVYVVLAAGSGALGGLQAPMLVKFTRQMRTLPYRSAWFVQGTSALFILIVSWLLALASDTPINFEGLRGLSFWKFMGGPVGTSFAFISIVLAPRLGMGMLAALNIAGQLVGSLCIDTFGLIGAQELPLEALRVFGVIVVYIAVILSKSEDKVKNFFGYVDKKEEVEEDDDLEKQEKKDNGTEKASSDADDSSTSALNDEQSMEDEIDIKKADQFE
eukprot:snap_masked-scaffold_6-processed-gene-15.54-mRNA-1 protein AED:1.00 eAED:1.00 QI:0/-1/0/0/-1/1/1/0/396